MKALKYFTAVCFTLVLFNTTSAQDMGSFWIKTFKPGSSDLSDPDIDQAALAKLDRLMQNPDIEVTFLGAADTIGWHLQGREVHPDIAEAWNDAKRLSRARALQARYKRGHVGITYENVAGVKVVWSLKTEQSYTDDIRELSDELSKLKRKVSTLEPAASVETTLHNEAEPSRFDWGLEAGFWTWQGGSHGSLISPSLALKIIINKTALVLQGGVTPWHVSSEGGNQSESFVSAGIKHMKTETLGFSTSIFRGWKFLTQSDRWTFKTTGIGSGIIVKYGIFELNPSLTYSNINTLTDESHWQLAANLGITLNINEAFK